MVISGIKQFYTAATAGIQAMMGTLWAKKDMQRLNTIFTGTEIVLHLIIVFLFSCIGILIVPFVEVYTLGLTDAEYTQPVFVAILTLAYAIRCLRTPYNIMILAAGHYKQTQKCHIIAAVLNLVFSVLTVKMFGLVGIAIGTFVALTYQTLWMMVYNSRNLLMLPWKKIVKQLAIDGLATMLILISTSWLELQTVSYLGWLRLAVPVALMALAITSGCAFLFFRRELLALCHSLKKDD
jgi:O-antigen/teichoic acid export membrane protein